MNKRLEVHMPQVETSPLLMEKLLSKAPDVSYEITDVGVKYADDNVGLIAWLPPEIIDVIKKQQGELEGIQVIVIVKGQRK